MALPNIFSVDFFGVFCVFLFFENLFYIFFLYEDVRSSGCILVFCVINKNFRIKKLSCLKNFIFIFF